MGADVLGVSRPRAITVTALVTVVAATGCGQAPAPERNPDADSRAGDVVLTPDVVDPGAVRESAESGAPSRARVVELEGAAGADDATYSRGDDHVSPGAPSDAEVRAELRQAREQLAKFKQYLGTTAYLQTGPSARVLPDGTAVAPDDAPEPVKRVIQAGNAIASLPYKWGGGHGAWRDNGYDCSGSVSFALAGAGLLDSPRTSGGFVSYGASGPGDWITIYANDGHMFMVVAGLRFDTSGQGRAGTRWQPDARSTAGYAVRHVPGL